MHTVIFFMVLKSHSQHGILNLYPLPSPHHSPCSFSFYQVSFVVDLVCERFRVGWRVALGIQCLLGIILIIGMLFLPETPR